MIAKEAILKLHELSVKKYGGGLGIRDEGLLDSAMARPYQSFDQSDLYPTPVTKAAAIVESIVINHPFIDGNKRIGLLALLVILSEAKIILTAPNQNIYALIISISTGEVKFEEIVEWLVLNSVASL